MPRKTFKAIVDEGIPVPTAQFSFYLMVYLNSPDGWSQDGWYFEPAHSNPDVLIHLSTPEFIEKTCGLSDNLSCAELGGKHMYLNYDRWIHGSPASKLDLEDYRQYMVSHEIGHILGKGHKKCPCKGCHAPIMMQQTLGIEQCIPNINVKK
jgi:hypothetical protein